MAENMASQPRPFPIVIFHVEESTLRKSKADLLANKILMSLTVLMGLSLVVLATCDVSLPRPFTTPLAPIATLLALPLLVLFFCCWVMSRTVVFSVELSSETLVVHFAKSIRTIPYSAIKSVAGRCPHPHAQLGIIIRHGWKSTIIQNPLAEEGRFLTELRTRVYAATGRFVGDRARDLADFAEWQKEHGGRKFFVSLFVGVIAVLLVFSPILDEGKSSYDYEKRVRREGESTAGVVVSHIHGDDGNPRLTYRFTAGGVSRERTVIVTEEELRRHPYNSAVVVRYLPETPDDSRLDDEPLTNAAVRYFLPASLMLLLSALLPLAWICTLPARRKQSSQPQSDAVTITADHIAIYGRITPLPDEESPRRSTTAIAAAEKKSARSNLLSFVFLLVVATLVAAHVGREWLATEEVRNNGVEVRGMVKEKAKTSSASKVALTIVYPTATEKTATRRKVIPFHMAERYRAGSPVTVHYLSGRPEECRIADELSDGDFFLRTGSALFLVTGIIGMIVSWHRLVRSRSKSNHP